MSDELIASKDIAIDDSSNQAIDPVKTIDEIKKEPYPLPPNFEWTDTDIDDDNIVSDSPTEHWVLVSYI